MPISNRTFGVELEFNSAPPPEVVAWFLEQNLGYSYYNEFSDNCNHPWNKPHKWWTIKDDFSITGPAQHIELSSPVLRGTDGLAKVRAVCRLLQKLGGKTNSSCGLHVHVGSSKLTAAHMNSILQRYSDSETLIDSWMTKGRRGNRNPSARSLKSRAKYIRNLQGDPLECSILRSVEEFRYVVGRKELKINFTTDYNTIEFRHHHGTLDPTEVSNWIQFCLNFVEVSADLAPTTRRVTKRFRDTGPLMGLSSRIQEHFRCQAERFL